MKNNEIAEVTRQSELARASALEAAGEHGDAAQVRAMVERDFPSGETMPRTAHDLLPGDTAGQYNRKEISGSYRTPDGKAQIDFGITYRNGYPEYTSSGHFDGSSGQCLDEILAAYPEDKKVKLFHARWKLHHLKNAEMFESLVRQEAARFPYVSFYETQAQDFLSRNGLKFRATLSDSKTPTWAKEGEETGHHYRVTLSRNGEELKKLEAEFAALGGRGVELADRIDSLRGMPTRLVFDFWGSVADARKGVTTATAYDVLACISSDAYTPETFSDFCAEYGYESDSIKTLQQFRRCDRFAKRLRAFFTADELTQLSEIQ